MADGKWDMDDPTPRDLNKECPCPGSNDFNPYREGERKVISFKGQMMLLSWSESSTRGRTVTFLLSEEEEEHPFKKYTIKSGKHAGQRFEAAMIQIGDDETPVEPEQRPSATAAILCKDPQFWRWADERTFDKIDSEEAARNFVCAMLSIKSRSEIDKEASLRREFDRQIVGPFNEYRRSANAAL